MISIVATVSSFFPVSYSSARQGNTYASVGGGPDSLDVNSKPPVSLSGRMQVKTNAQTAQGIEILETDGSKIDDDVHRSAAPRSFYNQLPDWSVLLPAALTTIFLAAEKQLTLLDSFVLGKIVQDGFVFRQNFSIRSFEIGTDQTASIETLMNHLQETALNHARSAGLLGNGFGSTPEMYARNLIWVVTKMQVMVERYPSWGEIVEVDTWVNASGKNGMRRDWLVRDSVTGQTITRASSVWVMMNNHTRKLSKIPEEVRAEIEPCFLDRTAIMVDDNKRLQKLSDDTAVVRSGLTPRWGDLDVNQHVNNVKYIGWILESAPTPILENHVLGSLTLEYRRECGRDSVLQSLTTISTKCDNSSSPDTGVECQHLLRLESGAEILRGQTQWKPKPVRSLWSQGEISPQSA